MISLYEEWVEKAQAHGFSNAGVLDVSTLTPLDAVREMCVVNKCGKYNKNWTCPPACGSIEENIQTLRKFAKGILVQTTAVLEDDFDYDTMESCRKHHQEMFTSFGQILGERFSVLALGAGGCGLCEQCTYPDAPCRHPGKAMSSMEAYGLLVSDVCKKNGLPYYYGPRTITYTGCYLW